MAGPLHVEADGHVRLLTMNRPDARNGPSGELIRALYAPWWRRTPTTGSGRSG
jgi:enoyl-CoA hydratase/carnithine racemase